MGYTKSRLVSWIKNIFLIAMLTAVIPAASAQATETALERVAIVPFKANSDKDLSYITKGISNMLKSRLTWKGKIEIIHQNSMPKSLVNATHPIGNQTIFTLASQTNADYAITGMITEFAGAYSIDTKVYRLADQSYLTFYSQTETIDTIITEVSIIAAKINKKVFDRTTSSYEKFEKDKKISEEELRRMNPERMLPGMQNQAPNKKPWWKIW